MKFGGHCFSVLESFNSNFQSIIARLTSINSEESVGLLETILTVEFILYFLFMKDIMHHLSSRSKHVQLSSSLPWDFPSAIDNLLNTLNACFDNITKENVKNSTINKVLFPNIFQMF